MPNIGHRGDSEIDWIVGASQTEGAQFFWRYEDWYRYNQDQKSMEAEALKVSTVRNQLGWSQGGMFKRIMSMPTHLYWIIKQVDPEFGTATKEGKAKVYRFLLRHPEFSVR